MLRITLATDFGKFATNPLVTAMPDAFPEPPARTAASRLKILILAPFAPDLDGIHGGASALGGIADILSRRHEVRVIYQRRPGELPPRRLPDGLVDAVACDLAPDHPTERSLAKRALGVFREYATATPSWVQETSSREMEHLVARTIQSFDPDVVHTEFHVMSQYIPTIRASSPKAKCIVTEHEPGISGEKSKRFRQKISRHLMDSAWKRYERAALRKADAIIAFTEQDKQALTSLLGKKAPHMTCIPLRLSRSRQSTAVSRPVANDLLFFGNYMHPPNIDAAKRLVTSIFPLVQREFPNVRLAIVGNNPPKELLAAAGSGINIPGCVADLSPWLEGAKVIVAPLRLGGGMRVKVIDACAAGRPLLASTLAVQGLPLRDGYECAIAETDAQFAEAACALLRDEVERQRIGATAKSWADHWLDPETWADDYDDLYRQLGLLPMREQLEIQEGPVST